MSTVSDDTSATQKYAQEFYELLVSNATAEYLSGSESAVIVYRGKLLDAFKELGISNVYYSRIRRIFLKYDCVQYLQRGTRSYDSVLVLNRPPPVNLEVEDLTDETGDGTLPAVAARVTELEHTVAFLENWVDSLGGINIVEALRNLDLRTSKLEANGRTDAKGS